IKQEFVRLREFLLKPDFVMDFEPGGRNPPPPPPPPLSQAEASLTRDLTPAGKPKAANAAAAAAAQRSAPAGSPSSPHRRGEAGPTARNTPAGDSSSKSFADGGENKNNEMDDQSEKNAGSEPLSGLMYNSLAEGAQHAVRRVRARHRENAFSGHPEASFACFRALKKIARLVEEDTINKELLVQNLRYAVQVLEAVYEDETKRLCNEDDDLPEVSPNEVPSEVRDWLASTFTRRRLR
uniref:PDEase_I_N domain-containing protein n=1 Tax=Macrostomum lignano TaxID=282301 RepID=A0A1I8FHM2_9PLAT